jgi:hypothetical protein
MILDVFMVVGYKIVYNLGIKLFFSVGSPILTLLF